MARGTISVTQGTANAGVTPVTIACDATNGQYIPASNKTRDLLIHVHNSGAAGTVYVQPGVYPPAFRQSMGTTIVAVGGSADAYIFVEAARHVQVGGDIWIDYSAAFSGYVDVVRLPGDI